MFCKKCGKEIPDGSKTCTECGAIQGETKFCKNCGAEIAKDCVICPKCGVQVETLQQNQPNIVINNSNENNNVNANVGLPGLRPKNKWVALCLCLFLGLIGGHKFYEGKVGMGILYMFTGGLFVIGTVIDFFVILAKPNPYYVC